MSGVSNTENLRALIRACMDDKGLSMQEVSDRAEKAGHRLAKSVVGKLAKDTFRSTPVTYTQIQGLAAGLGIPQSEVARAVASDMGVVDVSLTPGVHLLVAAAEVLGEEDLRVLRQMAERLAGRD